MYCKASLFALPALGLGLALSLGAVGAAEVGDTAGATSEEITATLKADGYEVRKVETEDGKIEAYAMKDGKRFEIYVDPATGKVTRIKEDD